MKRFIIIVGLLLGGVGFAQAQQTKIVAVAAVDRTENSQVSSRAARAPYYLIFEKGGKLSEVISNPFHDDAKVAGLLTRKNVTVVVAGGFGHRMKTALDEEGISRYETTGVVKDVVQELLRQK